MILSLNAVRSTCRIRRPIVRESLAELLGTMTLVFIGDSAIANNFINGAGAVNVPLGYGTALAIAVFATGGVSGGHLNPAVTLALCLSGRCDLNRLLPFSLAQYIGGFLGAALTHGLFFDLFRADPDRRGPLYMIFATYPQMDSDHNLRDISVGGAFMDQTMGTALLLLGIMAITDKRNMNVPKGLIPLGVGLTLFGVITCSGSNTGAALNPARDLGPRLYSLIIGYTHVFKYANNFAWIPVVACYVGAVIGAFVYFIFIELHHPGKDEDEDEVAADPSELAPRSQKQARHSFGEMAGRPARAVAPGQEYRNAGYVQDEEPERFRRSGGRRLDRGRDEFNYGDGYM